MPSVSRSQRRLFSAAEHGASFGLAKKLRATVSPQALHDFASGSEAGKPERVTPAKRAPTGQSGGYDFRHPHRNLGKYLHKARP